ncbi:MAG: arginine--tRNA ligase [Bacteroidetes bacterium]|nr:arginine--tRNA ligase [Bacteroidota bacterium]
MFLEKKLQQVLSQSLKELFDSEVDEESIKLQPTRKEFEGTHTFVTFPYLKFSGKSPEQTGQLIGEYLKDRTGLIENYNVVKGFLNLQISQKTWLELFQFIYESEDYGFSPPNGEEVMVEYSSPNTNKPLHLGHLRNNFLGYSVSRILEANGCKVHKVQIINDRGIHISKSMVAWQKFGKGETPDSTGIKGDKLVGKYYVKFDKQHKQEVATLTDKGVSLEKAQREAPIMLDAQEMLRKWEEKDQQVYQLWKTMNSWVYHGFNKTYVQMGVVFDKLYYESDTYLLGKEEVLKGLKKETFFKKEDGSVWVDLTDKGLDRKILLRSDGTSVYMTQDIGTAILRFKDFPKIKNLIYTVGNEQEYHFKVLFLILQKLGFSWAQECYHLSYGMVDLPSGKMKSREGTVVDADDLMKEMIDTAEEHTKELGKIETLTEGQAKDLYVILGLGALKFFLLKVDAKKRMLFDPQASIDFHGDTGPFVQYTFARISALLRRAEEMEVNSNTLTFNVILHPTEVEVLSLLNEFPNKVKLAAEEYNPSIIAQYVYDLAKSYNRFYAEVPVLSQSDHDMLNFKITFSRVVAQTISKAMGLLGIKVPKQM